MIFFFFIWCVICTWVYAADSSSQTDSSYSVRFKGLDKVLEVTKGDFPYLDRLAQNNKSIILNRDAGIDPDFLEKVNEFMIIFGNDATRVKDSPIPEQSFSETLKNTEFSQRAEIFEAWLGTLSKLEIPVERETIIQQHIWHAWGSIFLDNPIPHKITRGSVKIKSYLDKLLALTLLNEAFKRKFMANGQIPSNVINSFMYASQDENKVPLLYKTCSKDYVSVLCEKGGIHMLVVLPNFSLKRYYAYKLTDKGSDITFHHGDTSHDGTYLVTFLESEGNKYIAGYTCVKGVYNTINERVPMQRILIPQNVDMAAARVSFEINGHTCYCVYIAAGKKVYVTIDAKNFNNTVEDVSRLPNPRILKTITDPWIKKVLSGEDVTNVCRGTVETEPFFNKKALHRNFFSTLAMVNLPGDKVSCIGSSCIHYELLKDEHNPKRYLVKRINFNPDLRLDHLLNIINKKHELIKDETADSAVLYASILAIVYVYMNDWKVTLENLKNKMGVLYAHIDHDILNTINVQLNPMSLKAAQYWLYTKSQSVVSSVRTLGVAGSIKYALGTLWWGAKVVGTSYLAFNIFKLLKSKLQPQYAAKIAVISP